MKKCVFCDGPIPATVRVDGKTRNLKNRTRCLKCVPFGESVYSDRDPEKRRSSNAKRQRDHYAKMKREHGIGPTNARKKARKLAIMAMLGGACQLCGYDKVSRNLSFHHISGKAFPITENYFGRNLSSILEELLKCVFVCHNCHGEIHEGVTPSDVVDRAHLELVSKSEKLRGKTWADLSLVIYQ